MAGVVVRRSHDRDGGRLPPVIEAMTHREFYPGRPSTVTLIQTHASWVFIAGSRVYKIKKPVRFKFLDFSTLALRRRFCREEVRLNRSLAPDVYEGVSSIVKTAAGYALHAEATRPHPPAVEYAVRMRRLPDRRMLDELVRRGEVKPNAIRAIAAVLAEFHRRAPNRHAQAYGSAGAIRRMVMGNLRECRRFVGLTVTDKQFARIEEYSRRALTKQRGLLGDRVRGGRVREGHGDLRCEQICMTTGQRPVIFDRIEFSERLRYCDVASEVAFLAMDLDRLGASDLSDELVGSYASLAQDDSMAALMPFYKCYRAVVRGKVESLHSLDRHIDRRQRSAARASARNHFAQAYRYARAAGPAIVAVCGRSGAGKSMLAWRLHNRLGFPILSSDRTRKRLAGLSPSARVNVGYGEGIYAKCFTRRTYDAMLSETRDLIAGGCGVILDGTFKDRCSRRALALLARRTGVPLLFVECRVSAAEARRRIRTRSRLGGRVSDATVEIYDRQAREFAPLSEVPPASLLRVDSAAKRRRIGIAVETALGALGSGRPLGESARLSDG